MSPLSPGRRRREAAGVVLFVSAALLAGCAPAGATIPVGDAAFSSGVDLLDERVAVRMPDGVYLVEALGVRDEAFVDGETVRAPDGAVLVEVSVSDGGYVGDWAPGRTQVMLRAGDTEVPVELDPAGAGAQVAVLPGDGGDAELVLTFEGRDAVVPVVTADLVGGSPFIETVPWAGTLEAAIEPPAGWYPMVQAAVLAELRLVGYLPERGWAPEGEVWVEGRFVTRPGTLLPVGDDAHDGVQVAAVVEGASVFVDEVEYPLELVADAAAGGDAHLVIGTVPAGTDTMRLSAGHRLTTEDEPPIVQDATVIGPLATLERIQVD
ncbi:hypothetical protein [Jiangella sp. DSM 45060]|uniref:hypothetical protein n=1 Tax=Jiangella sp. DSM 45060 TaxID=1798224 RepID=UPI00087C2B8F|nr:hypothetical protein [Jiangella sp. DSM 45060]SDT56799.1 hypothetical protein SAMN04515669_4818 [Jiangella sp. DSM 45060]